MSQLSKGQPKLPNSFNKGDVLSASGLERMRSAIAFALKDMIRGGIGITVNEIGGRYVVSARKPRALVAPTHPFQIVIANNEEGDKNLIKFRLGRVNGQVPTIGDPPVEITNDVDDPANPTIELPGTETHYISINVTLNANFQPITYEIESATTSPTDTTTEGYYEIARVTTVDDVITNINQSWLTNATYFYAGDDEHIFFI